MSSGYPTPSVDPNILVEYLDFLADVSISDIQYLFAYSAEIETVMAQTLLFLQDESMDYLYYVIDGSVEQAGLRQRPDGTSVQYLHKLSGKGDMLGHFDLLLEQPYSTRARTRTPCTVLKIEAAALKRLLQRYPDLATQMMPIDTMRRLQTMPLFRNVDLTIIGFIAESCVKVEWRKGEQIYKADDPCRNIYLLDRGQIHQTWPDGREGWLGNGASFGLSDSTGRGQDVFSVDIGHGAQALVRTNGFVIDRAQLDSLTGTSNADIGRRTQAMCERSLADLPVFSKLSTEEVHRLAGFVSRYRIPTNHVIMQQGEVGDSMWILLPGGRAVLHALDEAGHALPNVPVRGPNFFGEMSLQVQLPMDSTVEAEQESVWLRLHWTDFHAFLEKGAKDISSRLEINTEVLEQQGGVSRERYPWLAPGETLIIFQKRHWIALLRKTFFPILLTILVFGAALLLPSVWPEGATWLDCLMAVLGLFAIGWLIWGIVDYRNDYLLVTNQRVVRQEKVVAFNERQQVALLERIENVDFSTTFMGRMLGYGEIVIRTAGTEGSIRFDYMPNTEAIKAKIFQQRSLRQRHHRAGSKLMIQRLLEERFGLTLDLPSRVVFGADDADVHVPRTRWEKIRNSLKISRHLTVRDQDRIIWRKHWAVLIGRLLVPLILFVLTLLLAGGAIAIVQDWLSTSGAVLQFVFAVLSVAILIWIAWITTDWHNDRYEVSDTQVVDIEKLPLFFAENRRTAGLGQIQNIELDIPSPLNYLLNYGNVKLQTAAEQGDFTFDWVPDPRGVADELRRRIDQFHRREQEEQARRQAQELPDWFETYNRLDADRG